MREQLLDVHVHAALSHAVAGARLPHRPVPGGDGGVGHVHRARSWTLSIAAALRTSSRWPLAGEPHACSGRSPGPILKEVRERLQFLVNVGLEYLTLGRSAETLSGGEAQRIRLATQIGSRLVGVLYILDEPSIGLHQRDNERLLATLKQLRDLGNTVLVVEHDRETILRGGPHPGPGARGGAPRGRHGGPGHDRGDPGEPGLAHGAPTCGATGRSRCRWPSGARAPEAAILTYGAPGSTT